MLAALLSLALGAAPGPGRLVPLGAHSWSWISGDDHSANGAVFVGTRAALVVDPGLTPALARELLAAVAGVTKVPVRWVVLTHWHPDHAMGVTCLADRPFEIVAHVNATRAIMGRGAAVAKGLAASARSPAERADFERCQPAPPTRSVAAAIHVDLGDREILISPAGPAHTDGDLLVYDPEERALATGDVFMHQASPDMGEAHPAHWSRVLDSLVSVGPKAVVAGHFGPSAPADLRRFRDYLAALIAGVDSLLGRQVPPDSVPARIALPAFADFAQYPEFGATIRNNAAAIVRERTKR